LEDTRASVLEEKPTVSALKEEPIALGEEKSTKATPDKKSAAIKAPQRATPHTQSPSKGVRHVRSRARAPLEQKPSSPQYFFDPFGYQQANQTSTVSTTNQTPTVSTTNYFTDQQARVSTPKADQQVGQPQTFNATKKSPHHTSKKTTAPRKTVQKRT
jgi:hypothetical protein